jgi:hypothetical protein
MGRTTDAATLVRAYLPVMAIRQDARTAREHPMSAQQPSHDHRRFRLATNDNETVVEDGTVFDDDMDVEGHRLATNDNETVVPGMKRITGDDEDESLASLGARRARR